MKRKIIRGISIIVTAALFFSVVSPGIVKAEENKDVVENVQEEVISENEDTEKGT